MTPVRNWMRGAAIAIALAAGGSLFAQQNEAALPPVPAPGGAGEDENASAPNWYDQVQADRQAKGWGGPRASTQNWGDRYTERQRTYDGSSWERYQNPRNGSSRQNGGRNSNQRAQAMEAQAQVYQQLYWMMKAQADAEQQQNGR